MNVIDLSWKGLEKLSGDVKALQTRVLVVGKTTEDEAGGTVATIEVNASHNLIKEIVPSFVNAYKNLGRLNICSNCMNELPEELSSLTNLREILATNNRLSTIPESFAKMSLRILNLSGNMFKVFPQTLFEIKSLRSLSMGGNNLREIPAALSRLVNLEILYLGGNMIRRVPDEMGDLLNLSSLSLCDNQIVTIPTALSKLHNLHSLSLHNNALCYLPREVLSLMSLAELSLRGNPLVARFARELTYDPPTLHELASRTIAARGIAYSTEGLPSQLIGHLNTASKCPNPKCTGVYFEHKYKQIKFVDFCGKYRLPLMQYLCSPGCISSGTSSAASSEYETEEEEEVPNDVIRRVLLG